MITAERRCRHERAHKTERGGSETRRRRGRFIRENRRKANNKRFRRGFVSPARGRRAGDKDIPPSLSARFLLTALTKRGSGVTRGSPGRADRAEETTARSTEENERDEDGRKPRGCASRGAATAGRADADSTRRRRLRFARSYPGSSGGHVSRSTTVSRSRARDTEGRRPERAARDVPSVDASRCF